MASETMVSAAIGGGVGASMQTMSRRRAGQSQVDLPARHARREMSYDFATGVFPFFRSRCETRGEPELKTQRS
jgi:hypothetical protein